MTNGNADAQLRGFVERLERLIDERKGMTADINDVYTEAASQGYHKPALKEIIRKRAMDAQKRQELEAHVETYQMSLGL